MDEAVAMRLLRVTPEAFEAEVRDRDMLLARGAATDLARGGHGAPWAARTLPAKHIHFIAEGAMKPKSDTPEAPVAPEVVEDWLAAGHTIRVLFVDRLDPEMARLCDEVSAWLDATTQANLYVTPGGRTGLNVHYDVHDVLVLQLEGRKRWSFYSDPANAAVQRLPLKSQAKLPISPHPVLDEEIVLEPGDVLYLPRGRLHAAQSEAETSRHVTISINPVRTLDMLLGAVTRMALEDSELRETCPSSPEALALLAQKLSAVFAGEGAAALLQRSHAGAAARVRELNGPERAELVRPRAQAA